MPFFPKKKISSIVIILSLFFIVYMLTGCVSKKTEDTKKNAQVQTQQDTTQNIAVPQDSEEALSQEIRQISSVQLDQKDGTIEINIQGNKKLDYSSMKQPFPFGIGVFLAETKIADDLKIEFSENKSISDLIVKYADKEKKMTKIEILLKEDLNYEVVKNDSVLKIVLLKGPENKESLPGIEEKKSPEDLALEDLIIPDETATMTGIEFNTMEDGKSDIVIQTNHPVKYDISRAGSDKLYLNLYNTIIPDHHNRSLLTRYFKSAVESLTPIRALGKKKNSKIAIKIREQVPYRISQNKNIISLFFEPSSIEPPKFTKATKNLVSGTRSQTMGIKEEKLFDSQNNLAGIDKSVEDDGSAPTAKYTGEKIKLDFYETDIKNVFRILRSVGGLNFAIDKDVKGKVTLTLENPVPWDQVLDLVLKMNSLGMKKEGNIIRIATQATLKKEEQFIQSQKAARKKAEEQAASYEALVTEYIPINYSDATADIKPHIEQILTKDRGKISVDKRTNMVIITDVPSKVDQAREIIYRLDKVTPQIMIEAKVVEVTKDFSRELGIGWGLTNEPRTGSDFTVALNNPISEAPIVAGSFNFFRLFGSSLTSLNAQIEASESKGDVKIVSSPRILTLDNKSAKIKQGLEYAYLERDDTGGASVKFKSIDLLLEVTPHVTPDKRIAMTVFLTKNDIASITNGIPSIATNEAETELLVNDHDTIIIGGIVKTSDTKGTSGVPILSGIPILGRLFRTDTDSDKRTELLIFLTPSIVQLEQKRAIFTTSD